MSDDYLDPWSGKQIDAATREAIIKEVGNLLRRLRLASGLKMVELAERCGISQSVLCRVELGRRTAGIPLLSVVCAELGVRLSDLFRAAEDEAVPLPLTPRSGYFAELLARTHSDSMSSAGD